MFDLAVFANPARLKRDFLATTEVCHQVMGPGLQSEFDYIKEESPNILMGGNACPCGPKAAPLSPLDGGTRLVLEDSNR
jgi:hypothetical protein